MKTCNLWAFRNLAVGAAFGTSKAGIGIAGLGQFKPELIMKVSSISFTGESLALT
jgi:hypothetical protein